MDAARSHKGDVQWRVRVAAAFMGSHVNIPPMNLEMAQELGRFAFVTARNLIQNLENDLRRDLDVRGALVMLEPSGIEFFKNSLTHFLPLLGFPRWPYGSRPQGDATKNCSG